MGEFITDRVAMIVAFDYMSQYFNKILYVNLEKDTYKTIKIHSEEASRIRYPESFSDWTKRFANSIECCTDDKECFLKFIDISRLKSLTKPSSINYRKMVDGIYHDVFMEIIPIKKNKIYIFVKDWNLMD